MKFCKVTAIIRVECLEAVEKAVIEQGAGGMSVTRMRGCGEFKDFFHDDLMVAHARVEIFTSQQRSRVLVEAIMEAAHTGNEGDDVIAVLPVDGIFRIREKASINEADV